MKKVLLIIAITVSVFFMGCEKYEDSNAKYEVFSKTGNFEVTYPINGVATSLDDQNVRTELSISLDWSRYFLKLNEGDLLFLKVKSINPNDTLIVKISFGEVVIAEDVITDPTTEHTVSVYVPAR